MPKESESSWDIRDDLSFVHLYCTDAHLREVGEKVWDKSPYSFTLDEHTFGSDPGITAVYRQFCLVTTGSNRPITSRLARHLHYC